MTPHHASATVTLWHGDCLDVLRDLADSSVAAVVTDPPYGLEFMGKEWDAPWKQGADVHADARTRRADEMGEESKRRYIAAGVNKFAAGLPFQEWCTLWAAECLRVLKPGGHLLAFGGTRTWHRLACAVEDAGFEVRDSIAWLYGSGFPKSLDVSKAIDKAAGAEREVVGSKLDRPGYHLNGHDGGEAFGHGLSSSTAETRLASSQITAPATPDAERWQGWGTALKPAFEPVVVARKPLAGTVAANVLAHGTGALNVDGCRVAGEPWRGGHDATGLGSVKFFTEGETPTIHKEPHTAGRWPANVILDESQAAALDAMSGTQRDGVAVNRNRGDERPMEVAGTLRRVLHDDQTYGSSGGASRFFYTAKAPGSERVKYFRPTCECENAWPATTRSPARVTDATTEPESSSTSKPGNGTTAAQSPTATRSTTLTATSSTTTPPTSSRSPQQNTSASTQAASVETANGGSRAASAESSSESAPPTGTSAAKDGHSTGGAARAISPVWSATSVCAECGSPTRREAHATVKPLSLMRWLVRLVTPPGGTVLEPFAGSGTTVEACLLEGFHCVAIEREADYLPLIVQRLNRRRDPVEAVKASGEDAGLFDLLDEEPA